MREGSYDYRYEGMYLSNECREMQRSKLFVIMLLIAEDKLAPHPTNSYCLKCNAAHYGRNRGLGVRNEEEIYCLIETIISTLDISNKPHQSYIKFVNKRNNQLVSGFKNTTRVKNAMTLPLQLHPGVS